MNANLPNCKLVRFNVKKRNIAPKKMKINNDFFNRGLMHAIYNGEIIDVFSSNDSNLRFDDKGVITHNVKVILSKYIRKDTHVIFIKNNKWTSQPINNEPIMVYNINWKGKSITFNSFENIEKFIKQWVETNARTIVVKGDE